jgi:hypothetical protein
MENIYVIHLDDNKIASHMREYERAIKMIRTEGIDESERRKAELRHRIYMRACNKPYIEQAYRLIVLAQIIKGFKLIKRD